MISASLRKLANELREAAGRHAYRELEQLAASLCQTAAEHTGALPAGDPQILEIAVWIDEQLEWTSVMLRTTRAAQADELRRIPFLKGYLRRESPAAAHMNLDL